MRRLESTIIHWTRQIKEVVTNQATNSRADDSGVCVGRRCDMSLGVVLTFHANSRSGAVVVIFSLFERSFCATYFWLFSPKLFAEKQATQ